MANKQNKTVANKLSPSKFLNSIENKQRKKDGKILYKLMKEVTGQKPVMWGESIIGYGTYHYKYDSGREGDMPKIGFSPRKQNMTIYIMTGFEDNKNLISKLGKCKTSKACLYINKIEDIDIEVLKKIIKKSYDKISKKYG